MLFNYCIKLLYINNEFKYFHLYFFTGWSIITNPSNKERESKISILRKQVRTLFSDIQKGLFEFYEDSDDYITLRLPVYKAETITEAKLEDFVDTHKINKLNIRKATKDDITIINDIYNKSWKESHLPMKEVTEELFTEIYEDSDTRFLIATFDGNPVGFILMEFSKTDKEIGLISGLAILPEYQNRGFGKYLALATWNFFKKQDIKELRCEVYQENERALKFIKSLGFEEYGRGGELYTLK